MLGNGSHRDPEFCLETISEVRSGVLVIVERRVEV